MKVATLYSLLVIVILLNQSLADNPVLCTLHQVKGDWIFSFAENTIKKGEYDFDKMSCGRHQPTKLVKYNDDPDAQIKQLIELNGGDSVALTEFKVKLTDTDYFVYHQGEGESKPQPIGNWTMIVHEGLLGFLIDSHLDKPIVFNNFFRYNLVDESKPDYESICYETMVGWFHTINPENEDDEDWGCFFAKKVNPTEEDLDPSTHIHFVNESPVFDRSLEITGQ